MLLMLQRLLSSQVQLLNGMNAFTQQQPFPYKSRRFLIPHER